MKMVFHVYRKVRSVQLTIQAHLRRSPKSIRSPPKKTSADETVDDECKRWTDQWHGLWNGLRNDLWNEKVEEYFFAPFSKRLCYRRETHLVFLDQSKLTTHGEVEVLVNLVCWQYFNILVRIITFLGNYYSSSIIFVLDNIFIIYFVMKMVFHV